MKQARRLTGLLFVIGLILWSWAALAQTETARAGDAGAEDGPKGGEAVAEPSGAEEEKAGIGEGPGPKGEEGEREKKHPDDGFHFGTYGRVQASTDFDGRPGDDTNVVAHGARLMEGPYLELDFGYNIHADDGFGVRVLATLAFFEEFFHFTGEPVQAVAMRNLYAEAEHFLPVDLRLWIGSRMYRGDDIYLLDYWPLDNLNTWGGGLQWDGYGLQLKWLMGVNRLLNDYQFERVSVPATFGADEITLMERQKLLTSMKATYHLFNLIDDFSMKFSLYGEYHRLPAGDFEYSEENAEYFEEFALNVQSDYRPELPSDHGGVIGAQLGLWGFGENSHLNLFFRYAWDLAAYGEWAVPWGVALDRTASGARELVMATSFNWESRWVGVMAGWYTRYFEDADRNRYDLDDYWEGILVARPAVFVTRHFHQMFEVSHQWKYPNGLGPGDDRRNTPHVTQLSVIPALSLDRGMYRRPQFRLVYTASHLNGDARDLFPAWDARRDYGWQHFFGAQVEWWLDSASYQ